MAHPNVSSHPSPAIDQFLFENIGIEPNGMPLTVLSLLARAGVDLWAEAERLATLSNSAAVSSLAGLIERSPSLCRNQPDMIELAASLVARLDAQTSDGQRGTFVADDANAVPLYPSAERRLAELG